MQQLIMDLLAYSRAGAKVGESHQISSDRALQSALANLQTAIAESGATVSHDALPDITMDELQLTQIFQNLIGNAIKYRGAELPHVHISCVTSDTAEWVFSVRDNGLGIESQYFEKIFVLFQRLHGREEFEGTGIGLSICKKLLERIGGRIWVASQPRAGSTFSFAVRKGVGA
jgi:light-regulated signal transduction histidine kinase (bacteriophytochrome)